MILAMLGTLGLTAGIFATLGFASYFAYSPAPLGALVGAVVGASLGVAFLDWRTILALGLAGALGFGIGFLAGDLLRASFPVIKGLGSIVVAVMIGGASLGATLGILETRRPADAGNASDEAVRRAAAPPANRAASSQPWRSALVVFSLPEMVDLTLE